jgi:putative transposase
LGRRSGFNEKGVRFMPRHQRLLSESGTYHVMMRGNEKRNLFWDDKDKRRFLDTLFIKKQETGFLIYAYCLMENHIHLLVREPPEGIATMMKRINTTYACYFNRKNHRVGHLFQDRFKSEPIEDERYLMAVIRYIHNNPVKAGIVERPEQYKWSSYNRYLQPHNHEDKMVDTEFVLSIMDNDMQTAIEEFEKFSTEQDENSFLETKEGKNWTVEEGKSYLEDHIKDKWSGKNLETLLRNKEIRKEIIADLKTNTNLSVREIADLMGINRGVVQKTVVDRKEW